MTSREDRSDSVRTQRGRERRKRLAVAKISLTRYYQLLSRDNSAAP